MQPSVYWISGGSGTLGTALTTHLLAQGHKVRAFARSDHRLSELEAKVPPEHRANLSCLPGSIEDLERVRLSLQGVEYVIHAAAMKRIESCEYSPSEAMNINVAGAGNVVRAVAEAPLVKRAVFVSSDKARAPSTLYGASKLCAERLWLAANRYTPDRQRYVACAYGNVFGSRYSVVERWAEQAQYGKLEVTDERATRFHMTLDEAVRFVLRTLHDASPGTLWVPRLPAYSVGDLAQAFGKVYSLKGGVIVTGRRPSEKLHEELVSENESASVAYEDTARFVLEPGKVHQVGGWSFKSCSDKTRRLTVAELAGEVVRWVERSS